MKVQVIKDHPSDWEHITFPTFTKGTIIEEIDKTEDSYFKSWHACKIAGHETFVPISFVIDGKLTRDYNPTELIQKQGDTLIVTEIVNAWLLAINEKGINGWIPAESVISDK